MKLDEYKKLAKKKSKYRNQKVAIDGYVFDSKKEANRYTELKLLAQAGKIRNLEVHPVYPVAVNEIQICNYIGDFYYWENGKVVIEDVKSEATRKLPTYRIKKKLVKAIYGIEITEI